MLFKEKGKRNQQLKRLVGIDFSRGWGLFVIIVIHLFNYWGNEYLMDSAQEVGGETPLIISILIFPFYWQGTWASLFAGITGASVAYTYHMQLSRENPEPRKRLKKTLINFLILLFINYLYIYLSIYPIMDIEGNPIQGLIPLSLKKGEVVFPKISIFFIASPLTMVAFSDLFVSLVCYFLWRKGVDKKKNSLYRLVFLIIGLFFLYGAEPIKNAMIPIMHSQYDKGNYFSTLILSWFVGGKQCIFPFVSYAFFSGILTLYLRDKKPNFQGMARFSYLFSAFILMMGIIHGIINGFPSVSEWYFGYHPFFLYHLNLAAQLIWFSSFVLFFDTIPIKERKSHKRYKYVIIFQRLSTISLTIFLFEEIFAAVYSKFTEIIFPNMIIQNNLFLFIWTFFYTFIWISTLNNWDKNCNFKFSIEWFLARIFAGKSTKKDSKRDYLNLDFMIYYPLGVKDKKEYYANKSNN